MQEVGLITVSERGQIVLPKKTRDRMKVGKGAKLPVFENDRTITMTKAENVLKRERVCEGTETFMASGSSLKKDWSYEGDDVWDDL